MPKLRGRTMGYVCNFYIFILEVEDKTAYCKNMSLKENLRIREDHENLCNWESREYKQSLGSLAGSPRQVAKYH